jgi:DNA-directed RNA polymerase subunit omega
LAGEKPGQEAKMTPEDGLDNNFRYVVMAARRARQLQNGSQPLIDSRSNKACRVAQEEIAAGKVKAAQPKAPALEVTAEPRHDMESSSDPETIL